MDDQQLLQIVKSLLAAGKDPTRNLINTLTFCLELADADGVFQPSTVRLAERLWGDTKKSSLANRQLQHLAAAGLLERQRPRRGTSAAVWQLTERAGA